MLKDALTAAAWMMVNLWAATAAARLARRLFPQDGPERIAMHTLVLLWAAIVSVSLLLGSLNLLRWQTMGAAMLLAACAVLWALRLNASRRIETKVAEDSPVRRLGSAPATVGAHFTPIGVAGWLWSALAALGAAAVVQRLLEFPKYWDDLMYHLPLVDHWIQDGGLYAPGCAEWYNPGNGELLGLWWAAPFSGDFLIGLANFPVVALLSLAALELGRELGLAILLRHAIAVAALASNVAITQLTDLENDVAVAAAFTAALAYGMRYARSGLRADGWLAAASLGLLAGVKYYALGYAAVAGAAIVCLGWGTHGRAAAARLTAATFACAAILSGYWYVRNWVVTGTPVYPLGISQTTGVLESVRPSALETTFFGNGRFDLWVQYLGALRQLTGYFQVVGVLLAPPAALGLLLEARLLRRGGAARAALAMSFLAAVVIFAITPFTVADDNERQINGAFTVVRYSQCPVLLGMLCAATILQDVGSALKNVSGGILRRVFGRLLVVAALGQLAARGRELLNTDTVLIALNLFLAGWIVVTLLAWPLTKSQSGRMAASALAAVILAAIAASLSDRWHRRYAANYDRQFGTTVFSRLAHGEVSARRIAVADYRYYPFFGSRRQLRAHRPFRILSADALVDYINRNKIDLLAVVRRDPFKFGRYPGIGKAAAELHDVFEKTDSGASFDVFLVRSAQRSDVAFGHLSTHRDDHARQQRGDQRR